MYPGRFSQSIVSSHHNLNFKRLFSEKSHNNYFFEYALTIRQQFANLKDIKINKKLQNFMKNGKFYRMIIRYPTSKNEPNNVLKIWAHHCECVLAQRLRRCQQMFCLYSKWWEERAFKEFIKRVKQNFVKKSKEFALGAIGISAYNWDEHRIPDEYMKKHIAELDYIYILKENTICLACDTTNTTPSTSTVCKCGTTGKANKTYEDWTPFIEKNDLIVWRRLHPSGQYEYKVYGSYNDVSAEDFLNVQIDTDYRRKWDVTAVMLEVTEKDPKPESNSDIIYWEMLWPRLFVNRDYVFNRRYLVDIENKTIYIVSKSTQHPNIPKYPEKYRIEDYWSCMVIKPYSDMREPGIEFSLTYFDNPGVNIPSSVTTWVSMRAMPDFLERLREASKSYREYCKNEGISRACTIITEEERIKEEQMLKEKLDYCSLETSHQNTKSAKYRIYSGNNIKRNINTNSSDNNSSSAPTAVQSKSDNFWKYLHPLYYFH